jgi:hypothetical protein
MVCLPPTAAVPAHHKSMGIHIPEPTVTVLDTNVWSDDSDDSDDRQGDDSDDSQGDGDGAGNWSDWDWRDNMWSMEPEEGALRTLLWVAAAANNVPLMALLCTLAHPDALENVECEIQAPTVQFGREFMARARNPLLVALSQECPRMRKVLCAYAPAVLDHPLARPMLIAALLDAARQGDVPSLRYYHAAWLPFHAASDEWDDRFRDCFTRDVLDAASRSQASRSHAVYAYLRDAMGIPAD